MRFGFLLLSDSLLTSNLSRFSQQSSLMIVETPDYFSPSNNVLDLNSPKNLNVPTFDPSKSSTFSYVQGDVAYVPYGDTTFYQAAVCQG